MIAHNMMAPPSTLNRVADAAAPASPPGQGADRACGASAAFADYTSAAMNNTTTARNDPMAAGVEPGRRLARRPDGIDVSRRVFSAAAQQAALRAMPGYIDGSKVLASIIKQWEEQGVSRVTIDTVRNGVPRRPRERDASAIFALGAALQASGAYERLRSQAIHVYRTASPWQETVARLQAEQPGYGRRQVENQLAETMLRLDGHDHRHDATVLDRLLRPEAIIDLDSDEADTDIGMMAGRSGPRPAYA